MIIALSARKSRIFRLKNRTRNHLFFEPFLFKMTNKLLPDFYQNFPKIYKCKL
nr:MAG TPA: hypothetical protein [Caudoviricetes sp.]